MKNKKLLFAIKICIVVIMCPAIFFGVLYGSMYISGFLQINKNIIYQDNHLDYLRNEYYSDSYVPCDEQSMADFDIDEAFEIDTYTEQLEKGVRNLEIDIETVDKKGDVSFIVTHNLITDNVSSAYDFEKGLEEIALWSDNNPGHMPVYLLIEPKGEDPSINNMKNFSVEYAAELDKITRKVLGDRLLTPKQTMGNYKSFE